MPTKKKTTVKKKSATHKSGQLVKANSAETKLPPPSCLHPHLVPLEVAFVTITHKNDYKDFHADFYAKINFANAFRVRKYYCSACEKVIKAPSIYAEEK